MPKLRLEDSILTAFSQAMADARTDVADHLLRALETLCLDEMLGSAVAEAYLHVARGGEPRGRH
jgi:hypothetical protein